MTKHTAITMFSVFPLLFSELDCIKIHTYVFHTSMFWTLGKDFKVERRAIGFYYNLKHKMPLI